MDRKRRIFPFLFPTGWQRSPHFGVPALHPRPKAAGEEEARDLPISGKVLEWEKAAMPPAPAGKKTPHAPDSLDWNEKRQPASPYGILAHKLCC
ncbi:hypothetical protein DW094_04245 [Ruminococcaceae bacterium AM07-15]|nr:hypothetical protein DW094_04245 [Ruminococcaceae bacterium AM07-15]